MEASDSDQATVQRRTCVGNSYREMLSNVRFYHHLPVVVDAVRIADDYAEIFETKLQQIARVRRQCTRIIACCHAPALSRLQGKVRLSVEKLNDVFEKL